MFLQPNLSAPAAGVSGVAVSPVQTAAQDGDWDILLQTTTPSRGETAAQDVLSGGAVQPREGVQTEVQEMIQSVSGGRELHWPDRYELLGYCREADSILAAVLLFFGIIYSAFGYTLFKVAVTMNIAGLGVWAGWFVGKQFDARLPGMVIGGVLFAALAWPGMRVAVAACGGLVGFAIGVAVWRSLGMADTYAAAGGTIGAIFLFMLSFSMFKLSILAFTAIQGAVMIVAGLLGLLLKYPQVDEPVSRWTAEQPALLPIILLALSVIALLFQQQWHRKPAEDDDD